MAILSGSYDTSEVDAMQRRDYWEAVVGDIHFKSNYAPDVDQDIRNTMDYWKYGDAIVSRFLVSPAKIERTPRHICRSVDEHAIFLMPLEGSIGFSQYGNEAYVEPGSFCMAVGSKPYILTEFGKVKILSIKVPWEDLEQRLNRPELWIAKTTSMRTGSPAIAASLICSVTEQADVLSGRDFLASLNHFVELMAFHWAADEARSLSRSTARLGTLRRFEGAIEARLSDPDLTLVQLAEQVGVSLRYFHDLFEDTGVTPWEYLKRRRLMRAQHLLGMPRATHTTIAEVAFAVGFKSSAHFSTAFKVAFGMTPTAYRQKMKRG